MPGSLVHRLAKSPINLGYSKGSPPHESAVDEEPTKCSQRLHTVPTHAPGRMGLSSGPEAHGRLRILLPHFASTAFHPGMHLYA